MAASRTLLALGLWSLAQVAAALEGRLVLKDGGQPVADAQVSVLGRTGYVPTDGEGRFVLAPTPRAPFEVLVTLPGGRTLAPMRFASVPEAPWVLEVAWQLTESITVSEPVAPGLEGPPASGVTLLAASDVAERKPANLAQALENVAGVVHGVGGPGGGAGAARPVARGRTLILIDGARVSSERRVGPSATYVDPVVLEAWRSRAAPGSVAYGSDAFGGVIRCAPGAPCRARPSAAASRARSAPAARSSGAALDAHAGLRAGRHPGRGALPQTSTTGDSPEGEVFNSGVERPGLPRPLRARAGPAGSLSLGWQSDFGRDIERPRNNSHDGALLLPDRGLATA